MRLTLALLAFPLVLSAQARGPSIDATQRDSVIAAVVSRLDRMYVFPEKVAPMAGLLKERRAHGDYDRLTDAVDFADALTRDLQSVSHDKHLRVRFGDPMPARVAGTPSGADVRVVSAPMDPRTRAASDGYGIGDVKRLDGNIAYLELRSFAYPAEVVADAVANAMTQVADADALIIDLRRNGGGSPSMVRLVASYLFGPDSIHLNSMYNRPANSTQQFWTLHSVAGTRFGPSKPVYLLTSAHTFSAAEEFAYDLQAQHRVTIVGETTGGGAHPGGWISLPAQFTVFVPSGRAINPVTKTNWEGVGVQPEIPVPADQALDEALKHAKTRHVEQ